jgi:SAM-dependent methyltransferase
MNEVIVDLGCGTSKVSGAIGIDRLSHPGVNIICDFETSLPLKSDSVDTIHSSHVIEHITNLIPFMEEVYRVCKTGASVYITTPYYTSRGAFRDPTHVRFIAEDTFEYFQDPAPYGIKTNFHIEKIHFKYRTFFRYFPEFIRKIFRKHLWNVADELTAILKVMPGSYK